MSSISLSKRTWQSSASIIFISELHCRSISEISSLDICMMTKGKVAENHSLFTSVCWGGLYVVASIDVMPHV